MISLLLAVCAFLLWRRTAALRRRIDILEGRLAHASDETAPLHPPASAPHTHAAPSAHAAPPAHPAPAVLAPADTLQSPPLGVTTAGPEAPPLVAATTSPSAPPLVAATASSAPPVGVPTGSPAQPPVTPAPDSDAGSSAPGWEVVVGASWLNKAGVLIFVTGLALLLGYAMAHVGPLGRVAMGLAIATAMLLAGVAIERRPANRAYGQGLIAGGWAGLYVTTFAMHAVPAARVVENEWAAILLLLGVACGMLGHSLRYRAPAVTALAYLAAIVPLALTPLTMFSLAAVVPLAMTLAAVSQRLGAPGLSLLSVGSAYLLFALRQAGPSLGGVPPVDADWLLAVYWIAFETADALAAARRAGRGGPSPLFAANAIGSIGCLFLIEPFDDPRRAAVAIGTAGAAYAVSAVLRAWRREAAADSELAFETAHAALWIAAGLTALAIGLRFDGPRVLAGLWLESQLFFVAALLVNDRHIRRIATAGAALVTAHALLASILPAPDRLSWPWPMSTWTPVMALVAAAWYLDREWLRRRQLSLDPPEHLYTWAATTLLSLAMARDVPEPGTGVAAMLFALALFVAGTRLAAEYRHQSYLVLFGGVRGVVLSFVLAETPAAHRAWPLLLAAAGMAYAFSALAHRHRLGLSATERPLALAEAGIASVVLLAAVEWRMVPAVALGAAWGLTAALGASLAAWRRMHAARWQGYALAAFAAMQVLAAIAFRSERPAAWIAAAIAGLFVTGLVSRPGVRARVEAGAPGADIDRAARLTIVIAAGALLAMLLADRLPRNLITMAWGLEGTALLLAGFLLRERVLRLGGLGLLALCVLKLFLYDLRELEPLGRILSFVVLGLVLLGVSWTYTKYREQIQKLL